MARTYDCLPRKLGCKNCACGNHRGCVMEDLPPPRFPYRVVRGQPTARCPCLKADNAKIKEKEKEERSKVIRLAAIEKALWGRSYEGKVTTVRPVPSVHKRRISLNSKVQSLKRKRLASA